MSYLPRSATPSQRRRARKLAKLKTYKPSLLQFLLATICIIAFVSFFPFPVRASNLNKSIPNPNPNPWGASALSSDFNSSEFGTVIGIDLGTTYSCVGIQKNDGSVEIIPNSQGNRITPSYVAFTQDGERLIGDAAKNQAPGNPSNTIFDAKRLIGRSWEDVVKGGDAKHFPFKVSGNAWFEVTFSDLTSACTLHSISSAYFEWW